LSNAADGRRAQQTVIRLKAPPAPCAGWSRLLEVEREQPDLQIALTTTTDHNVNFKTESLTRPLFRHMSAGDLLFEEALTAGLSPCGRVCAGN
jgi:LysR family glycine cleavage system transcriptional activator